MIARGHPLPSNRKSQVSTWHKSKREHAPEGGRNMRVRSNTYAIMESLSSLHDLAVPEIARRRAVETRARQESGARAEGARAVIPLVLVGYG